MHRTLRLTVEAPLAHKWAEKHLDPKRLGRSPYRWGPVLLAYENAPCTIPMQERGSIGLSFILSSDGHEYFVETDAGEAIVLAVEALRKHVPDVDMLLRPFDEVLLQVSWE